ncbi:MAG: glycosyltransferase family 2 protein [Cyanobium sp.]
MGNGSNLVSTIIPVYNRSDLLREAVESVLIQSHRPIEIIIVDDGSTDHTPAVCEELQRRQPALIRLHRQRNAGPGRARQQGLAMAQGAFIQFLDSDDLLLPDKFSRQVEALKAHPDAEIAYGKSYEETHIDGPPRCTGPMRATGVPQSTLFPRLLHERWWTTSCPLYRKRLLDRIGPIQDWINEEDWDYDARAAAAGAGLIYVDVNVSVRRLLDANDHLSAQGSSDPIKLSHRALARQSIFECAQQCGIVPGEPEMLRFSRSAFLLSRQCAEVGLEEAAAALQQLACAAVGPRRPPLDLRLYGWMGQGLGFARSSRWSSRLRRLLLFRRSLPGL